MDQKRVAQMARKYGRDVEGYTDDELVEMFCKAFGGEVDLDTRIARSQA